MCSTEKCLKGCTKFRLGFSDFKINMLMKFTISRFFKYLKRYKELGHSL